MASGFSSGIPSGDRASRGTGRATTAELSKSRPKPKLKKVMPEVWKLVKPRWVLLSASFVLMLINRGAAFVLPLEFRPLVDKVMGDHGNLALLPGIIAAVVGATMVQGATSYALTQMLSKGGQKLISELRTQVQAHIGRLPVAFYDENRTGTLVARIMTDVEGVRNLIGHGRDRLLRGGADGGVCVGAAATWLKLSVQMTVVTFCILIGVWADFADGVQDNSADLSASGRRSTRR